MRKILCSADSPAWASLRHRHVTASEAHSVFMLERPEGKKWPKTRSELVEAKRQESPADFPDSRDMWYGRKYEDMNRRVVSEILGVRSRPCHLMVASTVVPRLAATLDGLVAAPTKKELVEDFMVSQPWPNVVREKMRAAGGVGLLEMKQTRSYFGKEWFSTVPAHYRTQVEAQLICTGLPWAVIACRIGTEDFCAHFVEHPGPEKVEIYQQALASFWAEVGL